MSPAGIPGVTDMVAGRIGQLLIAIWSIGGLCAATGAPTGGATTRTGAVLSDAVPSPIAGFPPIGAPVIAGQLPLLRDSADPQLPVFRLELNDERLAFWKLRETAYNALAPQNWTPTDGRDSDQDGVSSPPAGNDCDDYDRTRSPREREVPDRAGKDEDCDAWTFANVLPCHGAHGSACGDDVDGDGYIDYRAFEIARDNYDRPFAIVRGADCNDSALDMNPATAEVPGDGLDNNCDGLIDEAPRAMLRDGYIAPSPGPLRPSEAGMR